MLSGTLEINPNQPSQEKLRSTQFAANPAMENSSLGKARAEGWTIAVPHPEKVTGKLLEIGAKVGITGLTALAIKDVADRITFDELNHITTLSTAGNPAATGHYLSSLQDKYAPAHTGNQQLADTALRNTGSNPSLAPQAPGHTGIKTTITPIPDRPSMDDLVYLAGGYEPNKGAIGNMVEFFTQPGDQFYLDARHKNHIEVFDRTGAKVKAVLNLDGSYNQKKTESAIKEGRRLPK